MNKYLLLFVAALASVTLIACSSSSTNTGTGGNTANEQASTAAPESSHSTSEPAQSTSAPAQSTSEPTQSTSEPAQTTPEPTQNTPEPAQTTSQPTQSTPEPVSTGDSTELIFEDDPTGLRALWHEYFTSGAEAVRDFNRDNYFFAFNDDFTYGAFMIVDRDYVVTKTYICGNIESEGKNTYVLRDDGGEKTIRFKITDTKVINGFEMQFEDYMRIIMKLVDQETIIQDMVVLFEAGIVR